ncbi:MAG: Veg family protein [Erysipelotrichaceae bacterium]|nr:Veg family protein [Erysipelotrichaceae bacterium]
MMGARADRAYDPNGLINVQARINKLLDKKVRVTYHNRGKDICDEGIITNAFRNVFVFSYERNGRSFRESFTYSDVMTEEIVIEEV